MKLEDFKDQIDEALKNLTPKQVIAALEEQGCEFGNLDENENLIDCRSEEGQTIGLIDALIHIAREVSKKDLSHPKIQEALQDLRSDDDVLNILCNIC
jgi:hypothetical protein